MSGSNGRQTTQQQQHHDSLRPPWLTSRVTSLPPEPGAEAATSSLSLTWVAGHGATTTDPAYSSAVQSPVGRITVSPASSIHEDLEEEHQQQNMSDSLSPVQESMSPNQGNIWQDELEGGTLLPQYDILSWNSGGRQRFYPRTLHDGHDGNDAVLAATTLVPPAARLRIQTPNDAHLSHGSQVQRELAEARAREMMLGTGPLRTSYGPAPSPVGSASRIDEITPAPPPPPLPLQQHQTRSSARTNPNEPHISSPFMHYEDLAYLDAAAKDELATGVARTETFPSTPQDTTRPKAKRSWDRQRKRRRNGAVATGNSGDGDGAAAKLGDDNRRRPDSCMSSWIPEILWCLLSIICLVAIVLVLRKYDGQGLPDWPLAISLNMLIAFLATTCQVAIVVFVTEGLSQLKWNSFARGERPISDFQSFEYAGRGPIGSAKLLFTGKGRALGMSAAAVLLTSFAVAPLTQAAVSYPTRLSEGSGVAMAAMSDSYTPSKTRPVLNDNLDAREKQAIQIGLYHAVGAKVPHISPICSSGECYWRNFSTLAVCAAVVDVSDKLVVSEQTSPSTLGISLGVGNGDEPVHNARLSSASVLIGSTSTCNLNMSSPVVQAPTGQKDNFLPAATSLAFSESDARVSSAVANFFVVYTNQTADLDRQSTAFRAAEVLLHFCVNKYEVSTAQGVSITTLIGSSTVVAVEAEEAVPVAVAGRTALSNASENLSNSGLAANVVLRSTADNKDYSVQRDDVRLLNRYIQTVFSGTYSYRHGTRIAGWTAAGDVFGTAMFERDEESGGTTSFGDPGLLAVIGNVSQNVATSMTNAIRAIDNKEDGIVLITESYIRVQWSWLAFLASQVAISTMFLLGIMVQTAVWKVKIVKGSAIATLFAITAKDKAALELERGEGEESPGMDFETNGMTRKLESLTCRLTQANRGWALDLARREIEGT